MFHSHLNSNWLAIYTKSLQSKNYRWIRTIGNLPLLLSRLYYKVVLFSMIHRIKTLDYVDIWPTNSHRYIFSLHAWGSFRICKHSIIGQRKILISTELMIFGLDFERFLSYSNHMRVLTFKKHFGVRSIFYSPSHRQKSAIKTFPGIAPWAQRPHDDTWMPLWICS